VGTARRAGVEELATGDARRSGCQARAQRADGQGWTRRGGEQMLRAPSRPTRACVRLAPGGGWSSAAVADAEVLAQHAALHHTGCGVRPLGLECTPAHDHDGSAPSSAPRRGLRAQDAECLVAAAGTGSGAGAGRATPRRTSATTTGA
jgi:hypothetical protein